MVFYRKYRPQTLDELIGQVSVKQTLKSALASGKLAHAYLFCGPKGTGKTSTARILAKIVNCEDKKSVPCNQCPSCVSITDGSNLDVTEMDAASNRGIEDIRVLRENIKLATSSSKKKVYIIDEVHMLSTDAFNALLKTLEEPPSHVLFILATTELQKIPQTILSRVQKLDFKIASTDELVEDLQKIVDKEEIKVEEGALLALAKKAQGSFRDAEKLLDQLSPLGVVTREIVETSLGSGGLEVTVRILESVAKKDPTPSLKILTQQLETGVNIKELNLSILDLLRQILFIKNDLGEVLIKPEIGEEKFKEVWGLAEKFTLEDVIWALDCFQKSIEQARYVSIPSLPLEMAVVESCQRVHSVELVVDGKEDKETVWEKTCVEEAKKESIINKPLANELSDDFKKLCDRWTYVLETARQYNYSLEALLRTAKISECSEKAVVMEVPYSFHQRILEAPKSRDLVESIFSDILGRPVKVTTVLGQRTVKREELQNVEVAADDEIIRIASEIFNSEPIS